MYRRMIINDLKKNSLVSAAACIFMAVSAAFIGLTVLLFANLLGSMDNLMKDAKTCDFLQMHSGGLDAEELKAFAASRDDVEDHLIADFLNIENSELFLNGTPLTDSTQDNGFCVQNENFDHMLGMDNEILFPEEGTVYVPVCYRSEYGIEEGQILRVRDVELTIAGFLRDSQMNSMMASSKRFLVSPQDYRKLEAYGTPEYLIEFRIKEGCSINSFATAYADAGLPCNGPTITAPLIRTMNALSDGLMILVILLVSVVILIISLICIRYIVLTGIEKDKKEAGMLKALGLSPRDIRKIYTLKYVLLSFTGGLAGAVAALLLSGPLGRQMRELYGPAQNTAGIVIVALIGILLTEGLILGFVKSYLKKNDRMTAVEAIRDNATDGRNKSDSFMRIFAVTVAAVFLMLVPLNMAGTVSSARFVRYMGIGQSEIRMDVRQCDNIAGVSKDIYEKALADERVDKCVLMQTESCRAVPENGEAVNLLAETGDHSVFPPEYVGGKAPEAAGEIALSSLLARDLSCETGDVIRLERNGQEEEYRVCGIYPDITNGGKTSKICGDPTAAGEDREIMWSILYVTLKEGEDTDAWISDCQSYCREYGNSVKITDIARYVDGTYGQTIKRIRLSALTSVLASCLILFVIVLLFVRLMIWQEKKDIALKKALGVSCVHIRAGYLKRALSHAAAGIAAGIVSGIVPGQMLVGLLLSSLGAAGFRFIIDGKTVFLLVPLITFAVAALGVRTGTREVGRLKIRL
ncbi:MAG: FtsX-like permease family protein [Lachnospiraceae bacterium]|nr:FtsX-like permease family protein [Lachnospiraceae bacterium]